MGKYSVKEENLISEGIYKTKIDGLFYIPHSVFPDDRGFFKEITRLNEVEKAIGQSFCIKQINHARSEKNVIRGFHAEGWKKLITITNGRCFCALADVRPESKSFLAVETFELGIGKSALAGSLFISEGIANSVCVLEEPVDYLYFVDRLYKDRDPKGDAAISLFDTTLNIEWPIHKDEMIISDRDKKAVFLKDMYPELVVKK